MRELLQTNDLALLSALRAALDSEDIAYFQFDGPLVGVDWSRSGYHLMVDDDDLRAARDILRALAPNEISDDKGRT